MLIHEEKHKKKQCTVSKVEKIKHIHKLKHTNTKKKYRIKLNKNKCRVDTKEGKKGSNETPPKKK